MRSVPLPQAELPIEPTDLPGLFQRFSPYVARIGLRLLGRHEELDDLVQEVFLAAHRGLGKLESPLAVKAWLATVTVRIARRRLRTRRLRHMLSLDEAPDYAQVAAGSASPEQRALLASIFRILDRVPVAERLAWSLRVLEGEPLEVVARLCGCSLATAKRRIKAVKDLIEREVARE